MAAPDLVASGHARCRRTPRRYCHPQGDACRCERTIHLWRDELCLLPKFLINAIVGTHWDFAYGALMSRCEEFCGAKRADLHVLLVAKPQVLLGIGRTATFLVMCYHSGHSWSPSSSLRLPLNCIVKAVFRDETAGNAMSFANFVQGCGPGFRMILPKAACPYAIAASIQAQVRRSAAQTLALQDRIGDCNSVK